jgi:hypothetical protein
MNKHKRSSLRSERHVAQSSDARGLFARQTPRIQVLTLCLFAFILYAQTLNYHEFVGDDAMVIAGNRFVQQGLAGIPDILTHDSFYGFDVQFNRQNTRKTYRPLSFITFAIEKQLYNNSMRGARWVQIALYVGAVVAFWIALRKMLQGYHLMLPYWTAALFAAHPIHTEVVANIKSRDELLAFLFIALALNFLFKYVLTKRRSNIALATGFYALALLSKESAVTFAPVFPIALWFFGRTGTNAPEHADVQHSQRGEDSLHRSFIRVVWQSLPLLAAAVVYVVVWFGIFGQVEEALYERITSNPFVNADFADAVATKVQVLGMYCAKALYPTTLSTGYTYNQIPITSWSDWKPLVALAGIVGLLGAALFLLRRRHLLAFCILAFFCTLAIASNFFVYAGGLLGERFLFTPSFAATLALAWLGLYAGDYGVHFLRYVLRYVRRSSVPVRAAQAARWVGITALQVLCVMYAIRTFYRNSDWESTGTLLKADTQSTPNSVLLRQMYAGLLLQGASSVDLDAPATRGKRSAVRTKAALLGEAADNLRAALQIDSTLPNLYNGLGNYHIELGQMDSAIINFEKARQLDSTRVIYAINLSKALAAQGMRLVMNGDTTSGMRMFHRAVELDSLNDVAYSNIGIIYRLQQRYDSAVPYLRKALAINPRLTKAQKSLSIAEEALRISK